MPRIRKTDPFEQTDTLPDALRQLADLMEAHPELKQFLPALGGSGGLAPSMTLLPSGPSAAAMDVPFEAYCRDDTLDVPRPQGFHRAISEGTFRHEQRILRQLATDGVPLDPPNADALLAYAKRHPKGRAALDNHRRAYARLMGYHGLPLPPVFQRRWDDVKSVERAKREGRPIRERERFFSDGPNDVLRLLKAEPFENDLMNKTFRHAVSLAALTGPRSGEPFYLRVDDFDAARLRVRDWWQPKKSVPRTIDVPEQWFWNGPGPSVKHYLAHVRPALQPEPTERAYFLGEDGEPRATDTAFQQWMGRAIRRVLGYPIGPHAFRRFCATTRIAYGWTVGEVADFLDDTEKVVESNYVDWNLVRRVRRKPRLKEERPTLPMWTFVHRDFGTDARGVLTPRNDGGMTPRSPREE